MARPHLTRAVAVAALCLLALLGACSDRPGTAAGPVRFDAPDGVDQWAFMRAAAGHQVVFGMLGLTNHGDRPAVLARADLTGPSDEVVADGARVAEVLVRDVSADDDYVAAAPWPYEHYGDGTVPLEGYELAPAATVEVLFVLTVDDVGHWYWPRTEVRYTIDGIGYTDRTSTGFLICPPGVERSCDPPA
ncbi:hypothetical protein GUY44_06855 [Pimelobacter simplex]|uniref:Lipoprotein n=1 Tax=Nocardioides simplex TaxID=2045 RepID=A0A0A1DM73_NOCSI|nr:hypothetical protein [Pimelobacter simplex]AIY17737.1 hypothetical protein KR76_14955 [Pimelobacter simplex]MCG8150193.1 hypothetical protein [Pimelobacter simplex]